jgi:hypothetical protein
MRRILLFAISTAFLGGGAYLLWLQLRCVNGLAPGTCYVMGRAIIGGAMLVVVGGYLLWDDFVTPWLRKQAEADLAQATKEHQQMQEFLADPQRVNQWKAVQRKCQFFASAFASDKQSRVPEIANNADAKLEEWLSHRLAEARAVQDDEYCRSAILDSIAEFMCKVGQFERAAKLIELITVSVIQDKARKVLAEEKAKQPTATIESQHKVWLTKS